MHNKQIKYLIIKSEDEGQVFESIESLNKIIYMVYICGYFYFHQTECILFDLLLKNFVSFIIKATQRQHI